MEWFNIDLLICFRLLCRDSGGETESMLLNETVPQWVIDITVDVSTSPDFYLNISRSNIYDLCAHKLVGIFHTYRHVWFCFRKICPSSTKSHSTSSRILPPAQKHWKSECSLVKLAWNIVIESLTAQVVLQGPPLSQWHAASEEGDGARLWEDHQPGQRVSDYQLLRQR